MPPFRSFQKLILAFGPLRFWSGCFVTALVVMSATGCGNSGSTVKVRGNVSYRGESITNGTVTFFPASGRPVVAPLADEGKYSVELPPGEYVVAIMIGATIPEGYKEGDPLPPPKIRLPDEYTIRAKSTLKAGVLLGQNDPINFDLK